MSLILDKDSRLRIDRDQDLMFSIVESISDNLLAVDKDWRLVYVNQGAKKHFRAKNYAELLGKSLWEIIPQAHEGTKLYQYCHKAMKEQRPLKYEDYSSTSPGWFNFSINPCSKGLSILFTDISEKKAAEEKLRESRKLFLTTFNNSPYMKCIVRLKDLTFIDVNDTWEKIIGYSRKEVVGKCIKEFPLMDYEEFEKLLHQLKKFSKIHNEEGIFYTRGRKRALNVLISAVIAKLDNEELIVISLNDITELRRYQAEVKRLDSLNLVGEMASGISHEIRNPLTTVKGFLQILSGKEENAKYLEYYNLMIEELERVNSIITEFLSLTKEKKSELKPANLTSIIKAILPLLQSSAISNDRVLKVDLKSVPDLLLDQKEIRQLLLNLVRNGLDAVPLGGVVKIMTYREDNQVVLAVADNGSGIPLEVQEKIGTPFFTTKEKGTGLGLSVCYSIVERHNAKLEFDTGPEGTTFYVRFKIV